MDLSDKVSKREEPMDNIGSPVQSRSPETMSSPALRGDMGSTRDHILSDQGRSPQDGASPVVRINPPSPADVEEFLEGSNDVDSMSVSYGVRKVYTPRKTPTAPSWQTG
ncbi:unnamed protein product, partial [Choristocarpus tenellus]